jgi:hypothetical protein
MKKPSLALSLALALVFAALPFGVSAQAWPSKPVRFILSLGPGSGADLGARLYADRLTKMWGQPVVVDNRPGGDGVIAINAVIQAKDDHTLLWGPTANFVGHPYSLDKMPYDPNELMPVARVASPDGTQELSAFLAADGHEVEGPAEHPQLVYQGRFASDGRTVAGTWRLDGYRVRLKDGQTAFMPGLRGLWSATRAET